MTPKQEYASLITGNGYNYELKSQIHFDVQPFCSGILLINKDLNICAGGKNLRFVKQGAMDQFDINYHKYMSADKGSMEFEDREIRDRYNSLVNG